MSKSWDSHPSGDAHAAPVPGARMPAVLASRQGDLSPPTLPPTLAVPLPQGAFSAWHHWCPQAGTSLGKGTTSP